MPDVVMGKHTLIEFHGCDRGVLSDTPAVERHMRAAADASGLTVVESVFHRFKPWGVSGVVIISESHLAVHTWPEHGYAAVDLFTCGDARPDGAVGYLAKAFRSAGVRLATHDRGFPSKGGGP